MTTRTIYICNECGGEQITSARWLAASVTIRGRMLNATVFAWNQVPEERDLLLHFCGNHCLAEYFEECLAEMGRNA